MESKKPDKSVPGKQAIVVIHGMGEQRPMETLRQFVDTVWNDDRKLNENEPKDKTWVTPDIGVGNTELMRIATDIHECRLRKNDDESAEARTDFFEFYWADIFADSRLSMLTPWVRGSVLATSRQCAVLSFFDLGRHVDCPLFDGNRLWASHLCSF